MHALFVGHLEDGIGNLNSTVLGRSGEWPNQGNVSNYKYSFIFMDAIEIRYGQQLFADGVYKTLIHELGHQRAVLRHASGANATPGNHDSPFCVMNQCRIYIGNNDNDAGNDFPPVYWSFYLNPHFCDLDISTLMDMTWKGFNK